MAESTPAPEPASTGVESGTESSSGMPRWVKVSLIIVAGLVVVFLILKLTGAGGSHGPGRHLGRDHSAASSVVEDAREIRVTADDFAFDPDRITVAAGENVAIVLSSVDILHDFVIDELDAHVSAKPGATATGGLSADRSGTYAFYCTEPGHRDEGMEGTLVVTEARSPAGAGEHRLPPGVEHGG